MEGSFMSADPRTSSRFTAVTVREIEKVFDTGQNGDGFGNPLVDSLKKRERR